MYNVQYNIQAIEDIKTASNFAYVSGPYLENGHFED